MDFNQIWTKIKGALAHFWQWLKPYLVRFHRARKRVWKQYHVNKILLLFMLLAFLITSSYLFYLSKQVDVGSLEESMKTSTVVYDNKDEEAGKLLSQKGTYVSLDKISPLIRDAVISTEDRSFYDHRGFDIKGIARAALRVLKNGDTSGGGGSTITQQLAKNAYLNLDQTFSRKAKELFLAIEIEKKYSKDQILEMYLNNSYMGNGVWGMQDAALKYFGVNASDVNLTQAATLAGMLKGPNIYNPIDSVEWANKRRNTVLSVMADNGKITSEQEKQAAAANIGDYVSDGYSQSDKGYKYPFYYDALIDEAVNDYGLEEADILNKGYKIYTSLDQNMQSAMENTYAQDYVFPDPETADGERPQSATIAIDPNSGGVQALVGRRGEHVYRGFNFATQMRRSPGSTIKPLGVYTPALEAGYEPADLLKDQKLDFYDVKNYSGTYSESGEVPMYQAVANSLNVPAVWLLHEIGLDKGFKKTKEFGLSLSEKDKYWGGVGLGGLEKGESPMTMAAAYAVFANGGTYYKPHLIRKIVDSKGAVIVDNTTNGKRIISQETSNQMTSMLLGTFSNGSAAEANPGYTMAGKTGTTETNFDAQLVNDQWIIGYTPNVVIASWYGFEKTSKDHYLTSAAGQGVGQVFRNVAANVLPYVKEGAFPVVDAYQTEGKVVKTEDYQEYKEEQEKPDWQKQVEDFGEKAVDGISDFGHKLKEGTKELFGGIWDKINGR